MFDFEIYSPEDKIILPEVEEYNVQLSLKRDDLIHPFISGNKWRKLKYNLIKARQENKTHLVTFGGVWSNHLLATACAAARFGFKSTAFVRGEDIPSDILFFCRMFGMQLIFTRREDYLDKRGLFVTHFGPDAAAYFINEGGSGPEAAEGCSEIISELKETYDHIFVAAGTGTTAAGLINGIIKFANTPQVHVVPVLKGADFLESQIKELLIIDHPFQFHSNYHFGGYAKTQPELIEFVKRFTSSTGIIIEPVYTGKMLYAVEDLVAQGEIKPGSKVLAIHTGGLFGILGMKEKFKF
ncbi:1-aminocyclopropane-1-carboxylate deaminase/D-cysteine desulfhydrase [Desertivirga arenae]|uniref:1-aminocyclopropane-1-carboxylate deaminase/D-cysteine desulfhydrase n=1 Tax=Desertivirga arenae TaxID=2810309 RepID=UPI001A96383B|nr:pyridoxal-phosphate dependent enzyme [Pedobacter sp. SYSU D00823]